MRKSVLRVVSAVGATFAIAACSDRTDVMAPRAPQGPAAVEATTTTTVTKFPVLKRLTPLSQDYSVSMNVGLLGGTILIPQAGLTVVIPPLALSKTTKITVTAHKGAYVAYTFQPHGLQFKLPVSMLQLTSLTNAAGNLNILSSLRAGYMPNGMADISSTGVGSFTEVFNVSLVPSLTIGPAALFTTKHFSGYAWGSSRTEECTVKVQMDEAGSDEATCEEEIAR
jgi:hypothetical protein